MAVDPNALLSAGAAVGSAVVGAFSTGRMNKKTRKWNEMMYTRQQMDALANWNRQNAYNAPEAQMARLQKAGLNPNLVYGNGAVANSSSAPDTPHAQPWRPQAPELPLSQVVSDYFDVATKKQMLSNQKIMATNMEIDGMLKMADLNSKEMLNKYMQSSGYAYRGTREYNETLKSFEQYKALQMLNTLNSEGAKSFSKDSMYSQQMESVRLLNMLRSGQVSLNDLTKDLRGIDLDFQKRIKSGSLSELNSAEWLKLLFDGIRTVK